MSKALQLEVMPPKEKEPTSNAYPIDPKLAAEAEAVLYDGMPTRDKVFRLHIQKGWELMEIARALGVSYQAIWQHWQSLEAEIAAAPADIETAKRRALMRIRLEEQFSRASRIADKERSIILCLKTLETMARLDGLNLENQLPESGNVPYAAPAEIASDVRAKILELHGRKTELLEPKPNA